MSDHITRYSVMPIPPVEAHTTWFDAGTIRVGVEYRLLTDAVAAAASLEAASGDERGQDQDQPETHRNGQKNKDRKVFPQHLVQGSLLLAGHACWQLCVAAL